MPRKKKSLEPATPDPGTSVTGNGETPPDTASETRIDQEAEHRMQAESPAVAEDAEAELEAEAGDTFEQAFDTEPLGTSVEDLAGTDCLKREAVGRAQHVQQCDRFTARRTC